MSILTNKPSTIDGNTSVNITLNVNDLKTAIQSITTDTYWLDTTKWKAVTFEYTNANFQKFPLSFNIVASNISALSVPSMVRNGALLCSRIDISGFANDAFSILRSNFTSLGVNITDFDTVAQNGYNPNPQLPSTLALYHFDGNLNGAYGNNLTAYSSNTFVTGRFNQGISFPTNSYAYTNSSFFNIGSGNYTIEMWLNFNNDTTNGQAPIVLTEAGIVHFTLETYQSSGTKIRVRLDGIPIIYGVDISAKVSDGNYHHVAIQRNSGTTRLFIDGVLVGSAVDSYTLNPSQINISGGGFNFYGYIDELRFSNAAMYNVAGFTPPSSPLS